MNGITTPENTPVHTGPKSLALDAGFPLDGGAMLSRDAAALAPHEGRAGSDVDQGGESACAASLGDCLIQSGDRIVGMVHVESSVCHVRDYATNTNVTQEHGPITYVNTIGERMKWARAEAHLTQGGLAKLVGISTSAIGNIEAGIRERPRDIVSMARALRVSPTWLETGKGDPRDISLFDMNIGPGPELREREYPVLTAVQAGSWKEICGNFTRLDAQEWRGSHKDLGRCGYLLRVEGESMTSPSSRFSFPPGMLLFCNPEIDWKPNNFIIATRENEQEATFKKIVVIDGDPYLEAINPEWPKRFTPMQKGDRVTAVVVDASFGSLI